MEYIYIRTWTRPTDWMLRACVRGRLRLRTGQNSEGTTGYVSGEFPQVVPRDADRVRDRNGVQLQVQLAFAPFSMENKNPAYNNKKINSDFCVGLNTEEYHAGAFAARWAHCIRERDGGIHGTNDESDDRCLRRSLACVGMCAVTTVTARSRRQKERDNFTSNLQFFKQKKRKKKVYISRSHGAGKCFCFSRLSFHPSAHTDPDAAH